MTQDTALHDNLINELKGAAQPLRADDTMGEAGRKIMLREFINMLKHEAGSRTGEDIADVHDMRVASRRIRSAFRLLEDYYKPKTSKAFTRKLRRAARALGNVRDLDVLIEDFSQYIGEPSEADAPAVERILAALNEERELARMELNHALDRGEHQRFIGEFSAFLMKSGAGIRHESDDLTPIQVRHVLPTLIYSRLGAVRAFDSVLADAIEQNDQTTLHALRIEFKRLRYAVSMFRDVLGKSIESFIEELKTIQDHLGDLQDAYTAAQQLSAFKDELDDDAVSAILDRYIADRTAEAEKQREFFAEVWKRFNSRPVQKALATAVAAL